MCTLYWYLGLGTEKKWYVTVSFASTAILLYIFLVPVVLWTVLKYRQVESRYSLLEILCLYGYSLSVYVPISVSAVLKGPRSVRLLTSEMTVS